MLRFVLFCAFLALGFAGSDSKYHHVCNDAFCRIIEDAASEVNDLKKLVDEGYLLTHSLLYSLVLLVYLLTH